MVTTPAGSAVQSVCFCTLVVDVTAAQGSMIPMTTLSHLGGGQIEALWVAADSVAVGGAYGSSNECVLTHHRVLLEWQGNVYVSCVHLVAFT